jgi:hypothetical protein
VCTNPTILNVDSHFILDSGAIELLTQPLRVKGTGLHDPEVSAMNSDLALGAIVTKEPVLPFNLRRDEGKQAAVSFGFVNVISKLYWSMYPIIDVRQVVHHSSNPFAQECLLSDASSHCHLVPGRIDLEVVEGPQELFRPGVEWKCTTALNKARTSHSLTTSLTLYRKSDLNFRLDNLLGLSNSQEMSLLVKYFMA